MENNKMQFEKSHPVELSSTNKVATAIGKIINNEIECGKGAVQGVVKGIIAESQDYHRAKGGGKLSDTVKKHAMDSLAREYRQGNTQTKCEIVGEVIGPMVAKTIFSRASIDRAVHSVERVAELRVDNSATSAPSLQHDYEMEREY